jgi:hypothetical protein
MEWLTTALALLLTLVAGLAVMVVAVALQVFVAGRSLDPAAETTPIDDLDAGWQAVAADDGQELAVAWHLARPNAGTDKAERDGSP